MQHAPRRRPRHELLTPSSAAHPLRCLQVWDARTSDCLSTFRPRVPGEVAAITDATTTALHSLIQVPKQPDHLIVGERSPTVYIMTARGVPVASMTSGKAIGSDFTSCALSSRGALLFCVSEDMHLYCFELDTGKLVHTIKVRIMTERVSGGKGD